MNTDFTDKIKAIRIGEKLGGQVGVSSTVGEGSTFWFTLSAVG